MPGGGFLSEINVTPLVDVMLVLLIIFMVTAPMMTQGIDVNLPKTTGKPIPTEKERLIISINDKGQIFIDEFQVSLEELALKVKSIEENKGLQEVLLKADSRLPYGKVIKVMSELKKVNIKKLGLVTQPEEEITLKTKGK